MKHVISFTEGMDKDTSFNKYPNTRYLHSENFRFIYDEENSVGVLTNDVGNTRSIVLTGKLLGNTVIRDSLILFILEEVSTVIYQVPTEEVTDEVLTLEARHKKLSKQFGNNTNTKIIAIGRYESDNVEKIYWNDGVTFRYCNLKDLNIQGYSLSRFESFPAFTFSNIEVSANISGNLNSGMVQYAYQLFNVNGASTLIFGFSDMISLTSSLLTGDSRNVRGDVPGVSSGKGITVIISNVDTSFDRIRLFRVHYIDINQNPEVYLVEERNIESSMTFNDTTAIGAGQIAFEELIALRADILPETIETKNNILFFGNITERPFDLTLDITVTQVINEITGEITTPPLPPSGGGSGGGGSIPDLPDEDDRPVEELPTQPDF